MDDLEKEQELLKRFSKDYFTTESKKEFEEYEKLPEKPNSEKNIW